MKDNAHGKTPNGEIPGTDHPPQDTVISKLSSCRWLTCYLCFTASLLLYTYRHCLSMAFVCMEIVPIDDFNITTENLTDAVVNTTMDNDTVIQGVIEEINTTFVEEIIREEIRINPLVPAQLQGTLLSCYYYGYLLTPLIGGTLASKFGPRRMIAICLTISSVALILFPICLRTNIYLAIAIRIIIGLASGAINPSFIVLWSHWAPINEKAQLAAVTNSGVNMASIVVTVVSASLCEIGLDGGWPFIFYVYGGAGILWLLLWMIFVFDSPETHPRITEREKEIIYHQKVTKSTSVKPPWKKVFKCPPFWALAIAHVSQTWIETTITTFIPLYMNDVLKFNIKQNGILSSLPFVGRFLGGIATAYIADTIQRKALMRTTYTRKMFQTMGSVVPAALLIGVSYLNSNQRMLAVALLTLTMTTNSTTLASFRVNHLDIAPRYSGQLLGFTQTLAIIGGIISPLVTAAITIDGTREQWQRVFIITATIVLFANIVFLLFGSGREQEWAMTKESTINIPAGDKQGEITENVTDLEVKVGHKPEVPQRDKIYHISGDPYSFVYEVTPESVEMTKMANGRVNPAFESQDSGVSLGTDETSQENVDSTRL